MAYRDAAPWTPSVGKMGVARPVPDRVWFLDEGRLLEQGTPGEVFEHPREERTRQFLSKVL